eukprot:jgi/Mesen1/7037/ME000367S06252
MMGTLTSGYNVLSLSTLILFRGQAQPQRAESPSICSSLSRLACSQRPVGGCRQVHVQCTTGDSVTPAVMQTCRQCKQPFDPSSNHGQACAFHPAHYGGEVKRKWKSYSYHKVGQEFLYHSKETEAGWGEVENYWDCCGRTDPFDLGCTTGPHKSYDDA